MPDWVDFSRIRLVVLPNPGDPGVSHTDLPSASLLDSVISYHPMWLALSAERSD
jgi:hypothetical protein